MSVDQESLDEAKIRISGLIQRAIDAVLDRIMGSDDLPLRDLMGEVGVRDMRFADFRDADLRGEDLSSIDFEGADFTGADLRDCDFSYATLRHAILTEANTDGARFDGADLEGSIRTVMARPQIR